MTLVVLRELIRGSTAEQLRVHNESDIDGALPPPVPWRHLVLKKERQMWATEESRRGRGCSFSRRFKLSRQFQLSGAKGSPLDKSSSNDAPRVPSDVTKREKETDIEGEERRKRTRGPIEKRERKRDSESGAYSSRLFLIKHDIRRFRFNCSDLYGATHEFSFYLKLCRLLSDRFVRPSGRSIRFNLRDFSRLMKTFGDAQFVDSLSDRDRRNIVR